ncbi:hypothetical protein GCM10009689_04800 [Brevibacterium antiquum]|uniref:hypothetical protein n=1 Tax=Brevibacterium antiquum TaxID=234835 RepID=UPI0018E03AA1|nr:hypothetical protein [Brevibacterium antiquum]
MRRPLLSQTHDSDHHRDDALDQFGLTAEALQIRQAIENVTGAGILPRDLGGDSNTLEMTEAIVAQLEAIHAKTPVASTAK